MTAAHHYQINLDRVPRPNYGVSLAALYVREVRRFLKVWLQTVLAPASMVLLFMVVFSTALGRDGRVVLGLDFATFLGAGLVTMAVIQNSFASTSSNLTNLKINGNIMDLLMAPITPTQITLALVGAGLTRGLIVAATNLVVLSFFVSFTFPNLLLVLFHLCSIGITMACLGIVTGLWARKYDHLAAISNFIVTPLSFLSGTFYSISNLPETFALISLANPLFYAIDGVRLGLTGVSDSDPTTQIAVSLAANIVLWTVTHHLIATGWRVKS